MMRMSKSTVRRMLALVVMGYRYSREEFERIAKAHGFEASLTESRIFSYRFHAVLRLKSVRVVLPRKNANLCAHAPISACPSNPQRADSDCGEKVGALQESRFFLDSPLANRLEIPAKV
jgi:hypothetical protein